MTAQTLYLELFAGISGLKFLGALIELGVSPQSLQRGILALGLGDVRLQTAKVLRQGSAATKVCLQADRMRLESEAELSKRIVDSGLEDAVIARSLTALQMLTAAEAKVQGRTVEEVLFPAAERLLATIVGCVQGLYDLKVEKIVTSIPEAGSGFITVEQGLVPLPSPATAELLTGCCYYQNLSDRELTTPEAVAVLRAWDAAIGSGRPETFRSGAIGYGAGEAAEPGQPDVLRAQLGPSGVAAGESLWVLETNIDDGQPQLHAYVMERLLAAGALDVWLTPVVMKKGRSGVVLSALAPAALRGNLESLLLRETTAIGCRYYPVARTMAEREFITVVTPYGAVPMKRSSFMGRECHVQPEFEDCRRLAEKNHIPLKEVLQAALQQYRQMMRECREDE